MPICEVDPWRLQYFTKIECPENVNIPTEDSDAYVWFPKHKWIYNKLLIAESQKLKCAPHGVIPPHFPVFSKPIYNMRGMGIGSKIIKTMSEYKRSTKPGYMWMDFLEGDHVSSDIAVINGKPQWCRHSHGIPLHRGTFDYWIIESKPREALQKTIFHWLEKNLKGYTGMVNLETIGEYIIEAHLRFSDQWPDIYGKDWVKAIVKLYAEKKWDYKDNIKKDGYSVVLFGVHHVEYKHPPKELIESLLKEKNITSIQITFHEGMEPGLHAMPPGGFRLAIINGYELEKQFQAREKLALSFWATQPLLKKSKSKAK